MVHSFILVYLDLIEYSKNNEPVQVSLFRDFQKAIQRLLLGEILESDSILIPTGDGIIAGIRNINITASYLQAFEVIVEVSRWAKINKCRLRSSIHVGDVNIIKDVNRHDNIVGNAINDAARILSGANSGGIVVSKTFVERFLRSPEIELGARRNINDKWDFELTDEDVILDKHAFEHSIYNLVLYSDGEVYGSSEKLLSKYYTNVYSIEYPKAANLKDQVIHRIKDGVELDFVGIYHPSLPSTLGNIRMAKARRINISVYYAADELAGKVAEFFGSTHGNLNFNNKTNSIQQVKEWFDRAEFRSFIKLSIYEYTELLPFGLSMINKNQSGAGFIHISHYLPKIIPAKTPYIETEWRTRDMPPIYRFYHQYYLSFVNGEYQKIREIS